MKKHYKHISLSERRQIYRLQGQGMSPRQIAQILGRHTSSIYREVWRNTHRHEERDCRGYYPVTAQEFAMRRRAKTRKLLRHDALRTYIVTKLREHWSPEQISGYLRRVDAAGIRVCHETIYRHVYSAEGRDLGFIDISFGVASIAAAALAEYHAARPFPSSTRSMRVPTRSLRAKCSGTGKAI